MFLVNDSSYSPFTNYLCCPAFQRGSGWTPRPTMGKKAKDEASKPKKDKDKKKVIAKAAEAPVAEAPKKQEPKKAKAPLTPEEEARRQWQRECREKALAARSSGESYVAARKVKQKKRPTLAQRKFERRQQERPSKAERNAERREQQKAAKIEKAKAPTVVIVPIFWKGEAQQMAVVLSVCADVQTALEASGVRCELDAGKKVCRSAAPTPEQQRSAWPDPTHAFRAMRVGTVHAGPEVCVLGAQGRQAAGRGGAA